MAIASRQDLIDFCLRKLGAPVVEINVDEDQIEDRIDEALQFYQEYHSDAIVNTYFKYQMTAEDIANKYITVPEELQVVKRVMPINTTAGGVGMGSGMFNVQYQMMLSDAYLLRNGGGIWMDLTSYTMTKSYIEMLNMTFGNGTTNTVFNRHMDRINLYLDWETDLKEGDWIIVEGSKVVDPETFTDVYNDMFLKRYATALIKRQWGTNMMKFDGMLLPGGVTFNGRQMFDDANLEIDKIEEEMQLRYEMPADFMIG